MRRPTFQAMAGGGGGGTPGTRTFVFSRTLRQQDYPRVTIVAEGRADGGGASRRDGEGHLAVRRRCVLFRSLNERCWSIGGGSVVPGSRRGDSAAPPLAERTKTEADRPQSVRHVGIVSLGYAVR